MARIAMTMDVSALRDRGWQVRCCQCNKLWIFTGRDSVRNRADSETMRQIFAHGRYHLNLEDAEPDGPLFPRPVNR